MFRHSLKKDIITLPNLLSLFRLILIPVYIVMYLNAQSSRDYYFCAGVLTLSCITDMLDGQIARRFNMISAVGKFLDPVADKATQFAMTLCLAIRYPLLWGVLILLVIKEIYQLIAASYWLKRGYMLKGALMTGKVCTTVLFVSLVFLVMFPTVDIQVVNIIAIVDFAFLMVAFIHYIITFSRIGPRFETVKDATTHE